MPDCGSLKLQNHLLVLIQRVPRYKLLFTEYLRKMPEHSLDREDSEGKLLLKKDNETTGIILI